MFLEEDGDRFCLMCGERVYDWLSGFVERLLEAMERQARREARHDHTRAAPGDDPHRAER
jgi:hypothetical protein